MSYVFISYSRDDTALAETVIGWLKSNGYPHWWDRMIEPGSQFPTALKKALDGATYVIVIWTSSSIKSDHVLDEAERARRARRLIPVAPRDLGHSDLPMGFGALHTITLDRLDDLRPKLSDLARPETGGASPGSGTSVTAVSAPRTIGSILREIERKFRLRVSLGAATVVTAAGFAVALPSLAIGIALGALGALAVIFVATQ